MDFSGLNETDVREEIIAPFIRRLGYKSGGEHNVIREQSLRYPQVFIGRKSAHKDPILRGKADYILEAGSILRWVIEAKAPDVVINLDAIEQAYTYANHPEVRAVYFVICNGRRLLVFQTNKGPGHLALIDYEYNELEKGYPILENILSPVSILRDHSCVEIDKGVPIAPGLRSLVRIANGSIVYDKSSLNIPVLQEMQSGVLDGAIERNENNALVLYLKTVAPMRSIQQLNQRIGMSSFEMNSDDYILSTDSSVLTYFRGSHIVVLPAGESLLDVNTWREVLLPINITCEIFVCASGFLQGNRFHEKFSTVMKYIEYDREIELSGAFELFFA